MNEVKADYDWMEEARKEAGCCWTDRETRTLQMDTRLAEAVAKRIAGWMQIAAQESRNKDYYQGLLDKCGKSLGDDAYIQDDGGKVDEPLRAKIPELVAKLVEDKLFAKPANVIAMILFAGATAGFLGFMGGYISACMPRSSYWDNLRTEEQYELIMQDAELKAIFENSTNR